MQQINLQPKELLKILKEELDSGRLKKHQLTSLLKDRSDLDLESILFQKDWFSISDKKIKVVSKMVNNPVSVKSLSKKRTEINQQMIKELQVLHVETKSTAIYCNCQKAIECLLKIEKKEQESVPKEIWLKLCADGRTFQGGQFVITLTPLNLKTFPLQSRNSCLQVFLATGKESSEEVNSFSLSIYEELQQLCLSGWL